MEIKTYTLWIVLKGGGYLRFDMNAENALLTTKLICGGADKWAQKRKKIFVKGSLLEGGYAFVDCSEVAGFYSVQYRKSATEKMADSIEKMVDEHGEGEKWKKKDDPETPE